MQLKWGLTKKELVAWQQEYAAGLDAAERGVSRFDNPHKDGTVAHRAWSRGHDAVTITKEMLRK